jgi:monoterpene epsilon-lactone hydrolase
MLDDSRRVTERAKAAGVEVTLEVWEGLWHVFHVFASRLPEGKKAIDKVGEFIRKKLDQKLSSLYTDKCG